MPAMLFWSVPLAILVSLGVLSVPYLQHRFLGLAVRYLLVLIAGLVGGLAWTFVVASVLGSWFGAFSFPVGICWTFGSGVGMVIGVSLQHPRSWPIAAGLVGLAAAGAVWGFVEVTKSPPQALVYVKPGSSPEDIDRVWREVLGVPDPRGRGVELKPGIMGASRNDRGLDQAVLQVSFKKGCEQECLERVLAEMRASPLVQRVELLAP